MSTERFEFDAKATLDAAVERLDGELVKRGVAGPLRNVIKPRVRQSFLRVGEETGVIEALIGEEWKSGVAAVDELAEELASHVPATMILPGSEAERTQQEAERQTVQAIVDRKRASGMYEL